MKIAKSVWLTIGSKFEHNNYTGFEFEPSAQLVWTPTDRQSMWLSAARAIRQPDLLDTSIHSDGAIVSVPGVSFGLLTLSGNPLSKVETLKDLEAGYRAQIGPRASLDLAIFTGFYHGLRSSDPEAPFFAGSPGPPHLVLAVVFGNKTRADTYGGEIFVNWSPAPRWRISSGYSRLHMAIIRDPSSIDSQQELTPGGVPAQQFQAHSSVKVTPHLEWDSSVLYVGPLAYGSIPGYTRVDTRLAWRPTEVLELSIAGQNLLSPRHAELPDEIGTSHTLVDRTVFGKVVWRF